MKCKALLVIAICSFGMVGCAVNQPPQQPTVVQQQPGSNNTVIIERDRVVPVRPAPCPPPKPGVSIGIGIGGCTAHRHCGRCDHCRRNGWVNINIR
jgi:hypothetical protein